MFAFTQRKIKKSLLKHNFNIVREKQDKLGFIFVIDFGPELGISSTFFIDKNKKVKNISIGAYMTLEKKTLTKSLLNIIQTLSYKHNITSSFVKDDEDTDGRTMLLQLVYNFKKFNEEDFILYINKFKDYIGLLYTEIRRCTQPQELMCLDISMFNDVDWSIFDPYNYIAERDKKFNGSWDNYILDLEEQNNVNDLKFVLMCKNFEITNKIPLDMIYDYFIDTVMDCFVNKITREQN